MPDLDDAFHIEQQQQDSGIYQAELRREPTTESLRALVNQAIVTVPHGAHSRTVKNKQKDRRTRILRCSKRFFFESKSQAFKDEEEDTKKILHERVYQLKLRRLEQRSPLNVNGKRSRRNKRDVIDTIKLAFGSSGFNDIPSAKSDDWFNTRGEGSALDLVLKVQGRKLPSDAKPVGQRPFGFLEKGIDSLGRTLGSINVRSGTTNGSSHTFTKSPKTITSPLAPIITTALASVDDDQGSSSLLRSPNSSTLPSKSLLSLEEYRNWTKPVEVPDAILEHEEPPASPHIAPGEHRGSDVHFDTHLRPAAASQICSHTTDEADMIELVKLNNDVRRIPLSIVTTNLSALPSSPNCVAQDLFTRHASSELVNDIDLDASIERTPENSLSSADSDQLTVSAVSAPQHPRPQGHGSVAKVLAQRSSLPNPNMTTHSRSFDQQRSNTVESSVFTNSRHTFKSASVSNIESPSSSRRDTASITSAVVQSILIEEHSRPGRKGKGSSLRHDRFNSVVNSPLLTNRVIDFGNRKFSKHLSGRLSGRPRSTTRPQRKTNQEFEAELLQVYREALEDDSPSLSFSDSIQPELRARNNVKYETDLLIQNQGGITFGRHLVFNGRFRSQPWQTIKMVKKYERPGDWDSPYTDDPPQPTLVQTPYTNLTFPLPTPQWSWVTEFEVDRRGRPVDADGWEYFDICHHRWKGHPYGLRTFSRKRRWVRTRVKNSFKLEEQLCKVDQRTAPSASQRSLRQGDETSWKTDASLSKFGAVDAILMEAPSQLMTLRLQRIGNQQIMKVARLSSLNVEPPLPSSQPFGLIWEDGELDYHNPFFSYQKLVEDFKRLINDEQHNLPLASLCVSVDVGLGLVTTTSPENGVVRWNEDDLMEHIGEPWKDQLAVINLRRAVKVLIDFSERQKIQIWRYWLGVDTYEQDSELDRPDSRDVWQVIERHMDEILELFIYQNSRYRFLHMISMLHSTSHPHHRIQSNSDLQLPECFSPITVAYPRTASQGPGETSIDRTSQDLTMDQDSQSERLSRKQVVDFIGLHARSRFSFWSDVSNLLITFNWKLNDDINLKARVAKEIRTELNRLVKTNLKKWTKQSK